MDYEYFKDCNRLIDCNRPINCNRFEQKQQINFIERLEENNICIQMETQKIVNLLNYSKNESSKFTTRKWYIINDQNYGQYGRGNLKQKSLNQIFVITQINIFL